MARSRSHVTAAVPPASIVRPALFEREKAVLVSAGILEVEGVLQNTEGMSVRALAVRAAGRAALTPSRDFH